MSELGEQFKNHIEISLLKIKDVLINTGHDFLVLGSGENKLYFNDDQNIPPRISSYFRFFHPSVNRLNCFVIIDVKSDVPYLYYHMPQDYWHMVEELPKGFWSGSFESVIFHAKESLEIELKNKFKGKGCFLGMEDDVPFMSLNLIKNPKEVINGFNWIRTVKTPYEISCLEKANDLAAEGHMEAFKGFQNGESEFSIHLSYLKKLKYLETDLPYRSIIAINDHSAILHYDKKNREQVPKSEDMSFLIDAGATCYGYHSDITRTYSTGDLEFKKLVLGVDKLQQEICEMVKPGVSFVDLHRKSLSGIAKILKDLKICSMTEEDMIKNQIPNKFQPHGLGHFLGLQVHDVGAKQKDGEGGLYSQPSDFPHLRCLITLEEGHVITIEPGLYIIEKFINELKDSIFKKYFNWDKIEKLKKLGGCRMEDDVLVTTDGHRNLTREAFKKVKELKVLKTEK